MNKWRETKKLSGIDSKVRSVLLPLTLCVPLGFLSQCYSEQTEAPRC